MSNRKMWMKIGRAHSTESLRKAVSELKVKWPDRFDYRIVADSDTSQASPDFKLLLRHR
jgi:hypothetical protein